jgi:hypothetical protein
MLIRRNLHRELDMSIAHSVHLNTRPRTVEPHKPRSRSLLKAPMLLALLTAQAAVAIWFFRESIHSPPDLARAVLMGCIPLIAIWAAMGMIRSMRTPCD